MLTHFLHQILALMFGFFMIYVMIPPLYQVTFRIMMDFFKVTPNRSHMIAGVFGSMLFLLSMRVLLPIAGLPLEHLGLLTGIVLTAVGFSFRSFAINAISYFYILWYDKIHVGDELEIQGGTFFVIKSIESQFFVLENEAEEIRVPLNYMLEQITRTKKGKVDSSKEG